MRRSDQGNKEQGNWYVSLCYCCRVVAWLADHLIFPWLITKSESRYFLFSGTERIAECEQRVSDYSYERTVLLGLIGQLSPMEKEEFKREVQNQLGLAPGEDCDTICGAMGKEEFRKFIEHVKEALLRKKRRFMTEELQPTVYA